MSDSPAGFNGDVPYTGVLRLKVYPRSQLDLEVTGAGKLDALDTALTIKGTCINIPAGTTGSLSIAVTAAHAAKPEVYRLPVSLKVSTGTGKRSVEVTTVAGGRPTLNAVEHGLWRAGTVALSLNVDLPHPAQITLTGAALKFDNRLEIALVPAGSEVGARVGVTSHTAPCFDDCVFSVELIGVVPPKAAPDAVAYRDTVHWLGKSPRKAFFLGVHGEHPSDLLAYATTGKGAIGVGSVIRVALPDEKGVARVCAPGPAAASLGRPAFGPLGVTYVAAAEDEAFAAPPTRMRSVLDLISSRAPTGGFKVHGSLTGFASAAEVELELRLYAVDGAMHTEHSGTRLRPDSAGKFSGVVGHFSPELEAEARAKKTVFYVAVSIASDRLAGHPRLDDLATFDHGTCFPLSTAPFVPVFTVDSFVRVALCAAGRTIDGLVMPMPKSKPASKP